MQKLLAAWTCSMDMQYGYAAWTGSMDMQHKHACSKDNTMDI
jgi:hypothetical protein